jgi:hypothetical protein
VTGASKAAASAFPLHWPVGVPRTDVGRRVTSHFKTALGPALKNVINSLRRFGEATGKRVTDVVLSTNFTLGDRSPVDPGVAVWFIWDSSERCIAVDRYPRIEHNLQAIHHILEARVTEARHGGLRIVQQVFNGFIALPAPEAFGGRTCWQVLDLPPGADRERIVERHRELARALHPDINENDGAGMADLNAARDAALATLS